MKKLMCLMLALVLTMPAFAFAETDEERIAALEERVTKLEALVDSLAGNSLAAQEEATPQEQPADDSNAKALSVGDTFQLAEGVNLTVTDFDLTSYFSYYSRQSGYGDYFGFSQFFGRSGSSYGQRTIRSGADQIYLAVKVRLENTTQDDISVGLAMNALARSDGDPVEPEQSFLYYTRNYDGYIAGETTLQLGPRSAVDGLLLFIMPATASDESNPLSVTFSGADETARYTLRGGESGLLLDQFGSGENF